MDLRTVRALAVVVEEGSFSRAATVLGFAQSTVSAQVRALEKLVGVALLDRTGDLSPTPAGRAFLAHARVALVSVERGRRAARQVAHDPAQPSPAGTRSPAAGNAGEEGRARRIGSTL